MLRIGILSSCRLLKNAQIQGARQSLSASGGPRDETYSPVRRSDEGRGQCRRWAFFSNLRLGSVVCIDGDILMGQIAGGDVIFELPLMEVHGHGKLLALHFLSRSGFRL